MSNQWDLLKNQINSEMEAQGVSKADLARRLGWPPPHVSRYLGTGEEAQEPGLDKIAEITAALNLTMVELYRRATDPKGKSGPQVVSTPPARDTLLVKLFRDLDSMSLEELQSVSNTVRLMREKLAVKRQGNPGKKQKSQAG